MGNPSFYFKVTFDQNINVLAVEPPAGNLIQYHEKEPSKLQEIAKKSIDLETYYKDGDPDPCMKIAGQWYCW